jgi:uncharacterized membrane protein
MMSKANPIIALLILAMIGFVSVMLGGLVGKLQESYKNSPWYPFKGM